VKHGRKTGLDIPLHLFKQVQTYEDFEDPRGKYICLLYVLSEPLSPEASIEAGDDASHVQWHAVENVQSLPDLAYNHIRLLRMALRQLFTSYYLDALGMQEIDACQCEVNVSRTALFKHRLLALPWYRSVSETYAVRGKRAGKRTYPLSMLLTPCEYRFQRGGFSGPALLDGGGMDLSPTSSTVSEPDSFGAVNDIGTP